MSNENPARKKFEPMLSPFIDGELTPEERQQVEQHLAANKESAMQVADFRAASGLMRLTFEQQADQEDWKDFSNEVLAKLTPDKPPLFERLKTSLAEMFTYQRGAFVGAMVGLERSILPAIAEQEFQLAARTALLSFIIVFGVTKALTNYAAGRVSDRFGRKHVLIQ